MNQCSRGDETIFFETGRAAALLGRTGLDKTRISAQPGGHSVKHLQQRRARIPAGRPPCRIAAARGFLIEHVEKPITRDRPAVHCRPRITCSTDLPRFNWRWCSSSASRTAINSASVIWKGAFAVRSLRGLACR